MGSGEVRRGKAARRKELVSLVRTTLCPLPWQAAALVSRSALFPALLSALEAWKPQMWREVPTLTDANNVGQNVAPVALIRGGGSESVAYSHSAKFTTPPRSRESKVISDL